MKQKIKLAFLDGTKVTKNKFKDWLLQSFLEIQQTIDPSCLTIVRLYLKQKQKFTDDFLCEVIEELLARDDITIRIVDTIKDFSDIKKEAEDADKLIQAYQYMLETQGYDFSDSSSLDKLNKALNLTEAAAIKSPELLKKVKAKILETRGSLSSKKLMEIMTKANADTEGFLNGSEKLNLIYAVCKLFTVENIDNADFKIILFIAYSTEDLSDIIVACGMFASLLENNKDLDLDDFIKHYNGFFSKQDRDEIMKEISKAYRSFQALMGFNLSNRVH